MHFDRTSIRLLLEHAGYDPETFGSELLHSADNPIAEFTWRQLSELQRIERAIEEKAAYLTREMATLQKRLDEGYSVNAYGHVQTVGPEIDRLCAQRQQIAEMLPALLNAYKASLVRA